MLVRLADGQTVPVHETFNPTWLSEAGVKTGESWQLGSVFDVADTDTYQFQLAYDGDLKLHVDGHVLYDGTKGDEAGTIRPGGAGQGAAPFEPGRRGRSERAAANRLRRRRDALDRPIHSTRHMSP